ncbi:MAG TPA: MarP family serine protease [Candidatus Saccharimonadales bacterium]|nr:MarP family serine protease [Candidatus Saccharimonadales bacterium]
MNVVDLIIIFFAVGALVRGFSIGLVRQAGSTIGFLVGLFAGSWLANLIVGREGTAITKSLTSLLLVLLGGLLCMTIGEMLALRLKEKLTRVEALDKFDGALGSVMAAVTLVFAIWLGTSILVLGPANNFQQSLKGSRILSSLNQHLPPATSLLSSLNKLIDPNGFPQVFSGLEPNPRGTANLPDVGSFNGVVKDTAASVVRVQGTGCGGIVEGSGFVVQPGEVATNAHVVAGVANPKVIDHNNRLFDTRVVWFDPDLDLAVLQVDGLDARALKLDASEQASGTPGIVAGYPGGGSFDVQPAAVIDHFMAYGRNIYGQGSTTRDVYSVQAKVIPGNSGGPLIGRDGTVLGIVFATSTSYNNVGYALTGHQVAGELATAEHSSTVRDTGSCSE